MSNFYRIRLTRSLRKAPLILEALVRGVPQADTTAHRDGPDGWNALEVMCHLRDFEHIFTERIQGILAEDSYQIIPRDPVQLAAAGNYGAQQFEAALAEWQTARQDLLALVEGLTDDQWQKQGQHPQNGPTSIQDVVFIAVTHDVDHTEQIIRILRR